jgi:RNA polymerase sigma-70 factor (ECF subfamily)
MAKTFEEQIGFHLDQLYAAALCFTLNEHRAEELLQETAIRAFHEFPRRRRDDDFRHYMLQMLVATYLQRRRLSGDDPLAADGTLTEEVFAAIQENLRPFPLPGSSARELMMRWLGKFWGELDDGDRLILWLADIERIRHRRIADMTGLTFEEVRWRHYRARQMLSRGAARELVRLARGGAEAC